MKNFYKKILVIIKKLQLNNIDEILSNINKWFNTQRKITFFVALIAGFLIHFSVMATGTVTAPDTIGSGIQRISTGWETSLGRWAITFVDLSRWGLVSPILITSISIILLSFTSVFLVEIFKIKKTYLMILMSIIVVSLPSWAVTFMYPYCADSYVLAMLLAVMSIYFLDKNKSKLYYFLSILCLVISLGLYQAYIGVAITLIIMKFIFKLIKDENTCLKDIFVDLLRNVLMIIISFVIYYIILNIFLKIYGINLSDYSGANELGIMNSLNKIAESIKNTYLNTYNFLFNNNVIKNTYYKRQYLNLLMIIIILFGTFLIIVKKKIYRKYFKIILIVLSFAAIPIGMNIITLIAPERTVELIMGTSLFLPLIFLLKIIEELENLEVLFLKLLGVILCCVMATTYIVTDNATYISRNLMYNYTYSTAIKILDRIENNENYKKNMNIAIVSAIKRDDNLKTSEVYRMNAGGISDYQFMWDVYWTNNTWEQFLKNYMGNDINFCTPEEYNEIINTEAYNEMGIFPEKKSVQVINNIMVVKLTNNLSIK